MFNKTPKGKRVTIKTPGIYEQILGKPRKIVFPHDHMLVEFRRQSTREVWFEVWPKPDDGKFDHPGMEKTIFLDGRLSDNGGSHVTIDADLGVQQGYQAGLVTITKKVPRQVQVIKDGQAVTETQEILQVEPVESREWVGLDGTQTWINERDVSFKQIAQANMTDVLKMVKQMMNILAVALIVVAIALVVSGVINYNVAKETGLIDGFMGG